VPHVVQSRDWPGGQWTRALPGRMLVCWETTSSACSRAYRVRFLTGNLVIVLLCWCACDASADPERVKFQRGAYVRAGVVAIGLGLGLWPVLSSAGSPDQGLDAAGIRWVAERSLTCGP
jgi:hypothetical protein